MDFHSACKRLRLYLEQSSGNPLPLPSGARYAFLESARYQEADLNAFEERWRLSLPSGYRFFLREVGACRLFMEGPFQRRGIAFYRLEDLFDLYQDYFEQPAEDLFSVYLPIAVDEDRQTIAAFAWEKEEKENLGIFWHETVPEDWIESADAWFTLEDWVVALVQSDGKKQ